MMLTQKTAITLSLAGVATLVWTGWVCANFVRDIRDEVRTGVAQTKYEIDALRADTSARFNAIWTVEDQREWIWQLAERNREINLTVPSVREVKTINGTTTSTKTK